LWRADFIPTELNWARFGKGWSFRDGDGCLFLIWRDIMFYFSAKSFSFGGGSKFSSGGVCYPSGGSYSYGGGSSWCPPKKPVVVNCPPKKFGFDFGALLKCFLPVYLCPP
jgi:hypothetical protein